jgi:hypothetical protein
MRAQLLRTAAKISQLREQYRSATGPRSQRVIRVWATELIHAYLSSEALQTGTVRAPKQA